MRSSGQRVYECLKVPLPSTGKSVRAVIAADGSLHEEASDWLFALASSPSNTSKSYGPKVAAYLSWLAGLGLSWREPELSVLIQWLNHVRTMTVSTGRNAGKPVTEATVTSYKAAVLHFYRWAAASGHVPESSVGLFFEWQQMPADLAGEVPTFRMVSSPALRTKPSDVAPTWIQSQEEMDRFLSVRMNVRDFALVTLLFTTGMRVGEALCLFRSDLHLTESSLELGCDYVGPHVHVHDDNEVLNEMATKDKRGRVVPVLAWWVVAYWEYATERQRRLGVDGNPHVFVNLWRNAGEAMKYDSVTGLFARLSGACGVTVTAHVLRHTRASWWLQGIDGPKVDVTTVKELLGHRSIKTTDVYSHVLESGKRAAVERAAPRVRGESAAMSRSEELA